MKLRNMQRYTIRNLQCSCTINKGFFWYKILYFLVYIYIYSLYKYTDIYINFIFIVLALFQYFLFK